MLVGSQAPGAGDGSGLGPHQGEQRALQRPLVQRNVVAHAEAPDQIEQLLQRGALGVQPQLVAEVEHPQVPPHLPLVGEEGGVAASPRLEPLDVVGDLAVEELLGLGAGKRQLAALGSVEQPAGGGDDLVFAGERLRGGHAPRIAGGSGAPAQVRRRLNPGFGMP